MPNNLTLTGGKVGYPFDFEKAMKWIRQHKDDEEGLGVFHAQCEDLMGIMEAILDAEE